MNTMIERYDNKKTTIKKDKRSSWFFLGILAIIVKSITSHHPEFIESIYSNTVFSFIRSIFDNTIGRLGFPVLYIVIPIMLIKILNVYLRGILPKGGFISRLFNFGYSTIAAVMWIVFWFTALWGLNYNRIKTNDRLDLYPIEITNQDMFQEMDKRVADLVSTRENILEEESSFSTNEIPIDIEDQIRQQVMTTMTELGYQPTGNVRIRNLKKGLLLRFGTAGFYFPFTGECNIDDGLHPLQKPFTMAHEMAHGYGVGNEGTCNFIAYLACIKSDNDFIRYSGMISFWRYVASSYRKSDPETYVQYRSELYAGLVRDLDDINTNNELYPDIMPWLRENAYDSYLKAQGEMDGIASYSKVIELILSFESQHPEHPLLHF
jgi:hypothetical protein